MRCSSARLPSRLSSSSSMAAVAAAAALLLYIAASRLGRPSWRTAPLRAGGRGQGGRFRGAAAERAC